jgi:predicted nucleic acid-binding protein
VNGSIAIPRGWLLDTSALSVAHQPPVSGALSALLSAGALFSCPALDAEALLAARSASDYAVLAADRRLAYQRVPMSAAIGDRAIELQATLARRAHLHSATPGDLVVAATALEHGLHVLHYSRAFTLLGELCGLEQRPVVPLGSLP